MRGFLGRDAAPIAFVALDGGVPVGTATLVANLIPGLPPYVPRLAFLYVVPEHRRRGLGAALTRHVESAAARLGHRRLYLYATDVEPLYARLGWRVVERGTFHGEPMAAMAIDLEAGSSGGQEDRRVNAPLRKALPELRVVGEHPVRPLHGEGDEERVVGRRRRATARSSAVSATSAMGWNRINASALSRAARTVEAGRFRLTDHCQRTLSSSARSESGATRSAASPPACRASACRSAGAIRALARTLVSITNSGPPFPAPPLDLLRRRLGRSCHWRWMRARIASRSAYRRVSSSRSSLSIERPRSIALLLSARRRRRGGGGS